MSDKVIDFQKFKADREAAKTSIETKEEGSLEDGLLKLIDLMETQDQLVQMLVHDLLALSDECGKLRGMCLNIGSSLSAVTMTLDQEGVLPTDKIQAVWEREMKPTLEKLEEVNKQKPVTKGNILLPTAPKIIIP